MKQIWNFTSTGQEMLLQNIGPYFESFNIESEKESLQLTVGCAVVQSIEASRKVAGSIPNGGVSEISY